MPREVQDNGVRWTCAQAYAGLSDDGPDDAAQIEGTDRLRVICTPSGGSTSVELELSEDWENALSDEELLRHIGAAQNGAPEHGGGGRISG
jgi:hypothetical protein